MTKYLRDKAVQKVISLPQLNSSSLAFPSLILVVDGLSLCYFLRNQCRRNPAFYFLEIYKKECEAFLAWLEAHNVKLASVIFDGTFSKSKNATRIGRRFQRIRTLAHAKDKLLLASMPRDEMCQRYAQELNAAPDPSSVSPFRSALIACLTQRNIEVVVTMGEADATIAARCNELAGAAVLGDDSDFFIMGVPLVLLSSLNYSSRSRHVPPIAMPPITETQPPVPEESTTDFVCEFFAPESVLACLKLPLNMMPYLSVLSGNDYSSQQLILKFARGAGFAGKISNSKQRLRHTLSWLQQTQNVLTALQKLFRKQKGLHEFEVALKATKLALSPEVLSSPMPASSSAETVLQASSSTVKPEEAPAGATGDSTTLARLFALHRSASIPPFVLGVFLHRKYWNPVIYEGYAAAAALLPLRNRFYRALLSLAQDDGQNPKEDLLHITEMSWDMEVQYDIDMAPDNSDFEFSALRTETAPASLDCLLIGLGIDHINKNEVLALNCELGSDATVLLVSLCMMKKLELLSSKPIVFLLLRQFAALKHSDWYSSVISAPPILPTHQLATVSSALIVTISWLKVLNKLSGNPLELAADENEIFDGYVLALLEAEEEKLKCLVDEVLVSRLAEKAVAFGLFAE